jgi:hypothetical protein
MEFLGKDKLARLDEERQRRRQQRADEALKRLEEIGKQTQQVARDQAAPGASDGKADDADPARRIGGLSRVLYETATGGQDLAGARQMRRMFKKKPELQAQVRQATGQIQEAMRTIQGAVANTALAGLKDGLAGAAAQVNDAVGRVSSLAQGRMAQNALADLMKEEHQDAEAEKAERAASTEKDPASTAAAAATEVAREEAPKGEPAQAGHGLFGNLRNTLQERAGGIQGTIDQFRATPGAIVDQVTNTPREMIDRVRTAPGAIVNEARNVPRELADQALAVPRQLGQQIANTPRELANDLVSAPRDAIASSVSAGARSTPGESAEWIERASNAPREIAQNLTDAPRHVIDNVRAIGEHVAEGPREHFGAIVDTARGFDPRNAVGEIKNEVRNEVGNDVAGFRTSFDPRRIAEDAGALDPHRLGERLAPHLDPRRIAEQTAGAFDPHQLLRDTAGGIVAGAMHDFVTRAGRPEQDQPAQPGQPAQAGQPQAPAGAEAPAGQAQAHNPTPAAAPNAPVAASTTHASVAPSKGNDVEVKKPTVDARHDARNALDHGHHVVPQRDHRPGHVDATHHITHHAIVHPAPHSASQTQPHGNPTGAALAPRGPEPGLGTAAASRMATQERYDAVRPTNIAPSASKAQLDIASRAPMNVQLQPVPSEQPRVDRQANPVIQPSFQINAKGNSGPVPNASGEQARAPQPAVQPPSQAAPPATQTAPTTSNRHVAPLPGAKTSTPAGSNPALAAARGTAAGLRAPQGSISQLPAGAAPAGGGTTAAPAASLPGAAGINTAAPQVQAPQAPQIPSGGGGGSSPAAPQTPTNVPAAPNIPEVHGGGGDSIPDPASMVQQTASLSPDRSAAASTINAEAATQSRVPPAAQSQKASEVTPLGPVMNTTARSADAPMAAANSSATSSGQAETASGRSSEQAEAASERGAISSQMSGASAQRAQYSAMPPPPIIQQTAPSAMQPLANAAQSAVHAAGAAVAATPAHISPGVIAQGQHAAATNSTLPPFDAARFNQIDHRAPLPPLETSGVDAAHEAAGQTYQAANQQVQQLSNIPAPQIQAPAGPVGAKTETGQPTREAAIARIEQDVVQQGQQQAPAQMKAAAAPVQNQATAHVTGQEAQGRSQAQAQVAQAQAQVHEVSNRPPPITGAQAAAQAHPQYSSHQAEATAAHTQMRNQIAQHQAQAEGQVQTARGQRDASITQAQGQYGSTVQGQVMPQYAAQQNAAHSTFDASKNAASAQMATDQAQAQAQAQTSTDQAHSKADTDISTHQAALASQQSAAYASHQQQVAAADAQHQAQMQQAQSQMDSQVAQHQAQMQSQVSAKQSEGQQQVNDHLTQGEQQYQQQIAQGTAQANAKKAQAEQEAAAKKAQADAEKKKGGGGGIFGAICSFVSGLVNDLLNAVKSILKAACDAVVSIMQAARNAAVAALNAARQAALAALNAVKSAIQGIITACADAIKAVISAAASLIKGLIQALASVLKSLVAALTTLLTTLVQAFKMAVDGILTALSAALSVVDKVLGTHLHEAVDRFRQKFDTAMNKLSSDIQAAGKALEAGIQKAADVACAAVDAAAHKLEQAVTTIEHALNAAVEAAYQLGAAAINKAFDLAEAAVNTAFDVAEAAVKAYVAVQLAMISAAQTVVTQVAHFVTELANKALEVVDKIAQAVVNMIPDSWVKAFVDFWNGPWRTMIIIGLATVAAVAITVATGGLGGPIAGVLLAGVIGGTLAGGAYFGGEMLAREGDIKLSDEGKGMYVPGFGYAKMGPDGKLIPPPGMSQDKLSQFEQQSQWATSNFNLQYGANGQVVGYDRKSGSDIGNYAVAEGIKGFGEGFISSALAVAGGGAGSWLADSLNMAGGTLLRSAVEGTVANVITGPVQQGLTSAWEAGFDAIKNGKSPFDALKAAWGAGSSQLSSPGNWAGAMMMMGIGPAKLKFLTPALEGTMENVESRALKTIVSRGSDIAFDTMGQTFGQAGGNFIGAYADAIAAGKSPGEALDAARQAADASFDPANIAATLLMNTAGSVSGPAHGGHQPIDGEYGTRELGRTRAPEDPAPAQDRSAHEDVAAREAQVRDQGGGPVELPPPRNESERLAQGHLVEHDATVQQDRAETTPPPSFFDKLRGGSVDKGPQFDSASRDFSSFYGDQSRQARETLQVSNSRLDQMVDEFGVPMYNSDGTPYGYGGEGRFDVNRYTNASGEHLTEITMKVHLEAGEGVTPEELARVQADATAGVDHYYNSGHRLPNGDHLNVKVEFVDNAGDAHLSVDLTSGKGHADQTHWFTEGEGNSTVHAHELGHQLGLMDEYYDPRARFRNAADSLDVTHDGSLMGNFWGSDGKVSEGTGIRERHLQQIHDDIQRARAQKDLAGWQTLYDQRQAIAEGRDRYATMPEADRQRALGLIDDRIASLKQGYEEAMRDVEAAAQRPMDGAERARQANYTGEDYADHLSTQAVENEREAVATADVRKVMKQLADDRTEVEEGKGPWEFATQEQRDAQLELIDDQLQVANLQQQALLRDLAARNDTQGAPFERGAQDPSPQAPGAPGRSAEDRLPPLPPEADRQVRSNIRQIEEIQRQIERGEGQYAGMTSEQRQQQLQHWNTELERQMRWANDNAIARTNPARWDGQTPRQGEVWSFESKSGNFYRGEFRGFDSEGRVLLDMGNGPVPLNTERLVSARPGRSAPELHRFGPEDKVTLYSVRGNPHTGTIEGYDHAGNVILRTDHGVETLRVDQLDLGRTHQVSGPNEHQAAGLVHFGADAEKHIALATKLGLMPDHEITVGNAKYKVGEPFDIGQGRYGVLIEVEVDGKRYMRVAYRSNSQGGFRLLPARNKELAAHFAPGYDKAIGEHAIMLPNAVDELLSQRVVSGDVRTDVPPDQAQQVFEGGVPVNRTIEDYDQYTHSPDHVGNSVRSVNILAEARDQLKTGSGHDLTSPTQVRIADPKARPDFSRPVRTYRTETSVAGPVDALVYRSHDGKLEYVVYKDAENHVWIKSVSVVDPKITAHGVSSVAIDAGALTTPYWEYRQQIPHEYIGETNPRRSEYSSAWDYLKQMPEIRAWYEANGVRMPDGPGGQRPRAPAPRAPAPPEPGAAGGEHVPGFDGVMQPHPDEAKYRLDGPSNFHFKSADRGQWPDQLRNFAADQFHVDKSRLQVKQFGAGKSGDLVFGMSLDGKSLGVLKVYRDPGGAGLDAHILHLMHDAGMEHYQPAEDKGRIGQVTIDGSPASSLFTELVPGRSVEDLIDNVPPSARQVEVKDQLHVTNEVIGEMIDQAPPAGGQRAEYMDMLDRAMTSAARSYAELHTTFAKGDTMSRQRRVNESRMILGKLDAVRAKNDARHFADPAFLSQVEHRLRDVVGPKFVETDLPATAFHGDAHVGNIQLDEHMNARPIDLTSMQWGMDEHGRGTGTGAVDVGQFVARLYEKSEGKLSLEEINRLKKTFLTSYFEHSSVPEDKMRPAMELYAVESQLARIQFDIGNPKDAMRAISEILGMKPSGSRPAAPRPPAPEPRLADGPRYLPEDSMPPHDPADHSPMSLDGEKIDWSKWDPTQSGDPTVPYAGADGGTGRDPASLRALATGSKSELTPKERELIETRSRDAADSVTRLSEELARTTDPKQRWMLENTLKALPWADANAAAGARNLEAMAGGRRIGEQLVPTWFRYREVSPGTTAYRGDSRPPEVVFADGFQPKGDHHMIFLHLRNVQEGDFVSVAKDIRFSRRWMSDNEGPVYELRVQRGIDSEYGVSSPDSPIKDLTAQREISTIGGIKPEDVLGAWVVDKQSGERKFIPNPHAASGAETHDAAAGSHQPAPAPKGPSAEPGHETTSPAGDERGGVSMDRGQASALYDAALGRWNEAFDRAETRDLIKGIADGKKVTKSDLKQLKDIRLAGAQLRSSFFTLSKDHEPPKALHKFVRTFGQLNDAIEAKVPAQRIAKAKELLAMLEGGSFKKVSKGIDKFEPTSGKSFDKFMAKRFAKLSEGLEKDQVPIHDLHRYRKAMKDMMNVLDFLNSAHPDPELAAAYKRLHDLNSELGDTHDEFVHASLRGELDYEHEMVPVPTNLRETAHAMHELFGGARFQHEADSVHEQLARKVPIPKGWQSRTADNGDGLVYQRPGAEGNADMIRVMAPTERYPLGYLRYYNSHGQPLDLQGKPGNRASTHIPLDVQWPIPGWPQ